YDRHIPARGRLRRSHPQGRKACRPSGAGANQVRAGDQPQDRQGARHRDAGQRARPRRRGDRMIGRRAFISLLGGAAAAWPLAAGAQQRPYRIGHLAIAAPTDTPPPPSANWNAFVQGLREAGYTEGQNIDFEHRSAHDKPELFPKLASELADLKVDVIFARGTWALAAAKNATRTIPIAGIDLEIDPVEAGFVAGIARPGGNNSGMVFDFFWLGGKNLQLLKEIITRTSPVGVLRDPRIKAPPLQAVVGGGRPLATG